MNVIKVVVCLLLGACLILLCSAASFAQGQHHHNRGEILVINDTHNDIPVTVENDDGHSIGEWTIYKGLHTYLGDSDKVNIKVQGNYRILTADGMKQIKDVGDWHDGHWTVRYIRSHRR